MPLHATGRRSALLLILNLLAACASAPQTQQLLASPHGLPPRIELHQTPFFPQQDYHCGPAALATVLNASGLDLDAESLVEEVFLPSRQGALQLEMLASIRRHNRLPYVLPHRLRALLEEVAAGNPVLVLQNLGLDWAPQWHYAVVVGFDLATQQVILRSGTEARHLTNLHTFELTWSRGDYWATLALPTDRLPATAEAETYLRAVVSLEQLARTPEQWRTIQRAYATALRRWPDNVIAHMGLGNSAYRQGDLAAAAQAFRAALDIRPDAAAAYNNLAQVLLEQGKWDEALAAAQRAVALGGQHSAEFRATLAAIRQAQQTRH